VVRRRARRVSHAAPHHRWGDFKRAARQMASQIVFRVANTAGPVPGRASAIGAQQRAAAIRPRVESDDRAPPGTQDPGRPGALPHAPATVGGCLAGVRPRRPRRPPAHRDEATDDRDVADDQAGRRGLRGGRTPAAGGGAPPVSLPRRTPVDAAQAPVTTPAPRLPRLRGGTSRCGRRRCPPRAG
jgi:hypothetical protein